jgi:lipopolysaccharide/colanic/teichoic acid biosynthesis glycosyltransferase
MEIGSSGAKSSRDKGSVEAPSSRGRKSSVSICKRSLDVLFAVTGFILGFPLLLLIALLVRLESPGSVFFSQERLGLRGKRFRLHKFRKFPASWGTVGPGVTVAGDVRMTRVGSLLERTKLDELPQLWNILKGEMSFVGPRPESVKYEELFKGEFEHVLDFLPGIFGPNQIAFRNESAMYPPEEDPEEYYKRVLFPQKARADLDYFSQSHCLGDLQWIVKGVFISLIGVANWGWIVRHHLPVVVMDMVAIELGWGLAVIVRYSGIANQSPGILFTGMWLLPMVVLPFMVLGRCYRHTLRHIVLYDVVRLATVVSLGWMTAFLILLALFERGIALSLAPLGLVIALSFMVLPRIMYKEYLRKRDVTKSDRNGGHRILIYGVNDRAINLGSLLQRGFPGARLVGFLCDDPEVRGRTLLSQKVIGSERDLSTILAARGFDQIWFSTIPNEHKLKRIRKWTMENDIQLVILPQLEPFASLLVPESGALNAALEEQSESMPNKQITEHSP